MIAQITLVETAKREQSRNPETLPPEKKKTLANIGPDEVFPGENEEQSKREKAAPARGKEAKTSRGKSSGKLASKTSPIISEPAPPAETQLIPAAPRITPAPLPLAESLSAAAQPIAAAQPTPHWQIAGLAVLSLLVLIGLVLVLRKLRELFHEEKEENA